LRFRASDFLDRNLPTKATGRRQTVKILFVGDVIGKPGRKALQHLLPRLVDERRADYVIVNVENAAGGFGVTPDVLAELAELPIHCYTSGNHVWDKKEVVELFGREPRLLRPANYPEGNPGKGVHVGETATGARVATLHLEGQVFMKNVDSPFRVADRLLAELPEGIAAIFVDFHAEATPRSRRSASISTGGSRRSWARTPTCRPPTSGSCPAARRS
jgi:calcineurin-like phosphoesterase